MSNSEDRMVKYTKRKQDLLSVKGIVDMNLFSNLSDFSSLQRHSHQRHD